MRLTPGYQEQKCTRRPSWRDSIRFLVASVSESVKDNFARLPRISFSSVGVRSGNSAELNTPCTFTTQKTEYERMRMRKESRAENTSVLEGYSTQHSTCFIW